MMSSLPSLPRQRMLRTVEVELPMSVVIGLLLALRETNMRVQIHERSSDLTVLTATARTPQYAQYALNFELHRWHGTDTKVNIEGKMLHSIKTTRLLILLAAVAIAFITFVLLYLLDFILSVATGSNAIGVNAKPLFLLTLMSVTAGILSTLFGINGGFLYQWYSRWRWRNQLVLADTVSEIETRLQMAGASLALQAKDDESMQPVSQQPMQSAQPKS